MIFDSSYVQVDHLNDDRYYDYNMQFEALGSAIQLSDSGYLSIGFSSAMGAGYNYYATRVDKHGDKISEVLYTIPLKEISLSASLKSVTTNEFVAVGTIIDRDINGNRINRDIVLLKINQNGDTIWTKRYGFGIGTLSNPEHE